jgi:hypothetical protein
MCNTVIRIRFEWIAQIHTKLRIDAHFYKDTDVKFGSEDDRVFCYKANHGNIAA